MSPKSLLLLPIVIALVVPGLPNASAVTTYTQSVWFPYGTTTLDVLISESIHDPTIGAAINRAIQMWENGIAYWNPTLASSLDLRVYWPDSGTVPPAGFKPDIVVVPQGFMAVHPGGTGTGTTPTCYVFAPMLAGWGTFIRVTSHEFGHCLGLSHTFSNGVEYQPGVDIMGGGDGPKCPSNLNVQVLERVFNGQTGTISMSPASYLQAPAC